jgi:hypothetical protein
MPEYLSASEYTWRRGQYDREYAQLADGSWYWRLHLHGERLNGGISATRQDAAHDAGRAVSLHLSGGAS